MCNICHCSPCLSQCPNADEPETIGKCAYCHDDIEYGDEYIEYEGEYYHADCIASMTAKEIANRLLYTRVLIAGED